jgi:MraZ protein
VDNVVNMSAANARKRKVIFNSTFEHGLDQKHRLQIPAKWQSDDESLELTAIIWPKHQAGACLRVLTPEKLDKLIGDIEAMPSSDPRKDVLRRLIGGNSEQLTVDKSGRITLPEHMARAAGIKDKAVLVGLFECFEIWSPERRKHVEAADLVHQAQAFEIM